MTERTILYLPHGGGPMPLMGARNHQSLIRFLREIGASEAKPSAILIISAHWEAPRPTVNIAANPALYFDYSGFPPETYEYEYPAPGEPHLAGAIADHLSKAGLTPDQEEQRGLDHGVFVPLMLMYPDADIPVVQLSLVRGLDPATHIAMGKALAGLDWPGLMVIGSGMSFHNPTAMMTKPAGTEALNRQFHDWMHSSLGDPGLSFAQREALLTEWEAAPGGRFCHPREEHLIPLHVCFGMTAHTQQPAEIAFEGEALGVNISSLIWR